MLPEAAGRRQHLQDLGHSFSLKGLTSRPIKDIALGSEIKKPFRVTYAIIISFYSGAERCKKENGISIIAAEKFIPHYKKSM